MDEKETFLLYKNLLGVVDELTDAQLGQAFRAALEYANGLEPAQCDDQVARMAAKVMISSIARNNSLWRAKTEKRRAAAKARWDAEKGAEQKNKPDRGNGQTYNLAEIEALMKANSEL